MGMKWIAALGYGVITLAGWGESSVKGPEDAVHRAALESRLQALQTKQMELEDIPGSLDQQRRYQAHIDGLRAKLGLAGLPFGQEPQPQPNPPPPPAPEPEEARSEEIDFFHDRRQVETVKEAIEAHGGIHPRSSLAEDLPRTHPPVHFHRAVSHPPKHGVVIDGDHPHAGVAEASLSGEKAAGEGPKEGGTQPPMAALPFSQPPSTGEEKASTPPTLSSSAQVEALSFPHPHRPPPLWTETASSQDHHNKTGWSVAPPPIAHPLLPGSSIDSAARVEAAAQQSIQQDPRLFSAHRLGEVWGQG